ncbi:MAG: hypothetical protein ACI8WB_005163 [Phenylobacterium sp.]|jgi:hypothetical protein
MTLRNTFIATVALGALTFASTIMARSLPLRICSNVASAQHCLKVKKISTPANKRISTGKAGVVITAK